jgi:hypothetical protein
MRASEVLGTVRDIPEQTLIKTLAKEDFENYKGKKKNKKDDISTSDINFTSENSRE